jgi:hypothetical protein
MRGSDTELTDRRIMAFGRRKSPKVLGRYVKRKMPRVAGATRTKPARLSE